MGTSFPLLVWSKSSCETTGLAWFDSLSFYHGFRAVPNCFTSSQLAQPRLWNESETTQPQDVDPTAAFVFGSTRHRSSQNFRRSLISIRRFILRSSSSSSDSSTVATRRHSSKPHSVPGQKNFTWGCLEGGCKMVSFPFPFSMMFFSWFWLSSELPPASLAWSLFRCRMHWRGPGGKCRQPKLAGSLSSLNPNVNWFPWARLHLCFSRSVLWYWKTVMKKTLQFGEISIFPAGHRPTHSKRLGSFSRLAKRSKSWDIIRCCNSQC